MHSFLHRLFSQKRQRLDTARANLAGVTLTLAELRLESRATRVISVDSLVLARRLPIKLFRAVYPPIYRQN